MKKIIVLLLCLFGSSSLWAQENTVLGTGALAQATTPKYAIQQIQVTHNSGYVYSLPTLSVGGVVVNWDYLDRSVNGEQLYIYGYFKSTTQITQAPSIVGGHGTGGSVDFYEYDYDGTYYYYEAECYGGTGYGPVVTLSSSSGSYAVYTHISNDGILSINYDNDNKTNLYLTAPTVSVSFGNVTATALLEGTAANAQNTAIGYQALYHNNAGENTALGHQSLYNATGSSNLGLGYLAGNTLTTGNNNLFIGKNAGKGVTTGSGNVFIGNGSSTTLNNALNNSVIIADGDGMPRIFAGNTGTVKIGYGNDFTETSGSKLMVNGAIGATGNLYGANLFLSGQLSFKSAASTYYHDFMFFNPDPNTFQMRAVVNANSYPSVFSVDKPSASMTFHAPVKGVAAVNNNEFVTLGQLASSQTIGANITGSADKWNGYAWDTSQTYADPTFLLTFGGGKARITSQPELSSWLGVNDGSTLANNISGSALMWNGATSDGGNYGAPSYLMTSNGGGVWGYSTAGQLKAALNIGDGSTLTNNISGSALMWNGNTADGGNYVAPGYLMTSNGGGVWGYSTASQLKAALAPTLQDITATGATTTNTIHAYGAGANIRLGSAANSGGLFQSSSGDNLIYLSNWADNTKSLSLNPVSGDVGIGGNIKLADHKAYLFNYASLSEGSGGLSTILGNNAVAGLGSNTIKRNAHSGDAGSFMSLNYSYGITFHTGLNSTQNQEVPMSDSEKMRIAQNGNVGVGTSAPLSRLHVQADANTSGAPANAQLLVSGNTHSDKRLSLAYNTSANYGELQSQAYTGGYTPILLNPNGGNVGIGTTLATTNEKLSVNGKIRAREIKVEPSNGWPDYVFEDSYKPLSLAAIAAFVKQYKHLPEVPSAQEIVKNGLELGEMNKILLKKIEELTLHLIDKEKELKETNKRIDELAKLVEQLVKKEDKN